MTTPQHPPVRPTGKSHNRCAARLLDLSHPRCRAGAERSAPARPAASATHQHTLLASGVATVALLSAGLASPPASSAAAVGTGALSAHYGSAKPSRPTANPGPVPFDPATLFTGGALRSVVSTWPVDPGSATAISLLSGLDLVVSLRQWTVPVYGAAANTALTDVTLTETWGSGLTRLRGVPMPAGVLPDPADDGHLTVVQPSTGCVYDLYRARKVNGSWVANWANAIQQDSSGIYPDAGGTRAAGFSAALGMIWPQEIERGRIDHALVFAYPYTASAFVAPALRSDGHTTTPGALPIGARLRLDPALDLTTLGLSRTELVIARALQEYGMVLGDTSGGFTLYAAHPLGLGHDPYPQLFGTTSDWASLAKLPKNRFQVLTLPAPTPRTTYHPSCATLS